VTLALIVLAGLVGVGDWVAVARRLFRLEYLLKPLTLILLIAAAASADLGAPKPWVIAALIFGLIGDVGLMLGRDAADGATPDLPFLLGLSAFLVGHLCYLGAFVAYGLHALDVTAGLLVVGGASVLALPPVLLGARRTGGAQLASVVAAYSAVLGAMAVLAVGTGSIPTAIGALLFLGSDIVLAWHRFVTRLLRGPVIVIVTYHLGQILILAGLVRSF
jgi:uncharacterized membrane protein YhhN